MVEIPQVPLEQWKQLYDVADRCRKSAPWDVLSSDDVFAVVNPEKPEAGYCSVLGQLGEMYGMGVHLGSDGLELLREILNDDILEESPDDHFERNRSLLVEFCGRNEIEKEDRFIITELGLKFRGANAWPMFRSYRPGYDAWFLEADEVRFLTHVLEQSIVIADRLRKYATALESPRDGLFLTRISKKTDDALVWNDSWIEPEPYVRPEPNPIVVDEIQVARIVKQYPKRNTVWELDSDQLPSLITDQERPYYLYYLMAADKESGLIVDFDACSFFDKDERVFPYVLKAIEKAGLIPERIEVCNERIYKLLADPLKKLNVKTVLTDMLPAVDEAIDAFLESMY